MGVIIGIDFGEKRVGVSACDPEGRVAFPVDVLDGSSRKALIDRIAILVEEREAERVVLGLPRNMNGSLGERAEVTLLFRDELTGRLDVPVDLWDERLTSAQAERVIRAGEGRESEKGERSRRRSGPPRTRPDKGRVDRIAAVLILQSYLDRMGASNEEDRS